MSWSAGDAVTTSGPGVPGGEGGRRLLVSAVGESLGGFEGVGDQQAGLPDEL
jgi:hypothetical protein